MAKNPFRYGRVVVGEDFADREKEVADLLKELEAGQNVILHSPRRYGKTSLMVEVLRQLRERGFLTALVDLFSCASTYDLAESLSREVVAKNFTRAEAVVDFLKSGLGRLRPELVVHQDGSFGLSLGRAAAGLDDVAVLEEVLDAPQQLARKKKKRVVVVLDEFQEISRLDGEELQKLIRSKVQHHEAVSYVFMGSKRHLLEEIFGRPENAFFRAAKSYGLGPIPKDLFAEYVQGRFAATEIPIGGGTVDKILEFTEGHPYFTQQLCHEVWNLAAPRGRVEEQDVPEAISAIVSGQGELYTHIWDGLSRNQRLLTRALATEETSSPYASEYIERHRLVSASHVKKSLDALVDRQIVEKEDEAYRVADPFLREWLRSRL